MNITFETSEKVYGKMTITIDEADFQGDVEKRLKDLRKRMNIPGFRPGMAPMGLVRRQAGATVKMDVINDLLGKSLNDYINEHEIDILGEPMGSEDQTPVDLDAPAPYTFMFDLAVSPSFDVDLSKDDKVLFNKITVSDEDIDERVDRFAQRAGQYVQVDQYEEKDMIKGDIRQLGENGQPLEGGIEVEGAIIMPSYIEPEDEKKLWDGAKKGDVITFNPRKAYPKNDTEIASLLKIKREEVPSLTGDFTFHIQEVTRYKKAEVNQDLFDNVYGEGRVKSEAEFRDLIRKDMEREVEMAGKSRFSVDLRNYLLAKVGKQEFPERLLRKMVEKNNKNKTEVTDKEMTEMLEGLTWELIKGKLARKFEVRVDDNDVLEAARQQMRFQFMQYGMGNVEDALLDQYAKEMLNKPENARRYAENAIEEKVCAKAFETVTLDEKEVTISEFEQIISERQ